MACLNLLQKPANSFHVYDVYDFDRQNPHSKLFQKLHQSSDQNTSSGPKWVWCPTPADAKTQFILLKDKQYVCIRHGH